MARRRILLVADSRFPGGTASAISDEIPVLSQGHDLRFADLETAMFPGRAPNARLMAALDSHQIPVEWSPKTLRADVIVLHNPAALKFEAALPLRMAADTCVVVTHENFTGPEGLHPPAPPTFDPAHALTLIDDALLARQKLLAPVSAYNARTVTRWQDDLPKADPLALDWQIAPALWPNICTPELTPPTATPRDRRGRHSRPGNEKFPRRDVLERLFPAHAEANVILGADGLLESEPPDHWELHPFGAMAVREFFSKIDFFVYFTNPFWRESFGRVIAEAIAAGKLVISDEGTAEVFGSGVIAASPEDVDSIIAHHVAHPGDYQAQVQAAQKGLSAFSAEAFGQNVSRILANTMGRP